MRAARFVFFLLLAAIPIQFGKHFWPSFSFVHGIRIDYLSPTLHVTDLIVVALILLSINGLYREAFKFFTSKLFILTVIVILVGCTFAVEKTAALFGLIKFLEFSYVAFFVSKVFSVKDRDVSVYLLTLGGVVTTIILSFQFILQSSLGGVFYYLGERTFSVATPGIATFHFLGQLVLRPYATFPHPNVTSFFLLLPITLLLFAHFRRDSIIYYFKAIALIVLSFGVCLTFSRIALLFLALIFMGRFLPAGLFRRIIWVAVIVVFFLIVITRLETGILQDIGYRIQLIETSFQIFLRNPIIGVGLQNFFYHEVDFQNRITPVLFQPVHNIYLYWMAMTGIAGGVVLGLFLLKLYKRLRMLVATKSRFARASVLLALFILFAGLFDHYFLTLQQGQLVTAIVLGLVFSKQTKDLE